MSFDDVTIGTARAFGWRLKGLCRKCGNVDHREIGTLIDAKHMSPKLTLSAVEPKLTCPHCRARDSLEITYDSSPGVLDVGDAYQAAVAAERAARRRLTTGEMLVAVVIVVGLVAIGTAFHGMATPSNDMQMTAGLARSHLQAR